MGSSAGMGLGEVRGRWGVVVWWRVGSLFPFLAHLATDYLSIAIISQKSDNVKKSS